MVEGGISPRTAEERVLWFRGDGKNNSRSIRRVVLASYFIVTSWSCASSSRPWGLWGGGAERQLSCSCPTGREQVWHLGSSLVASLLAAVSFPGPDLASGSFPLLRPTWGSTLGRPPQSPFPAVPWAVETCSECAAGWLLLSGCFLPCLGVRNEGYRGKYCLGADSVHSAATQGFRSQLCPLCLGASNAISMFTPPKLNLQSKSLPTLQGLYL